MDSRSNARTSLFLMELIIAVFFFSLAAAVCIRLFVSAHTMSEKTTNLSNATVWSQNLAEAFYSCKGNVDEIATIYPSAFITGDTVIIFFDKDWNITGDSGKDASYEAILSTGTKRASVVYSDVPEYRVAMKGDAAVGNIAILDIRNTTDIISSIPMNSKDIIFSISVDYYDTGKEAE
ncbi:MAG: hypothetical protein IKZ97_06920 [Butyrivibrio sp.]|nr:hypothetical protein [Butyrivibrio sp.]